MIDLYRPRRESLAAHSVLGIIAAGVGFVVAVDPRIPVGWVAGAALIFAGVWMFVRAFRLGVTVVNGVVTVRGLLWSRQIAVRSIVELTDLPALKWTDDRGRNRWTPVIFLMSWMGELAYLRDHNQRQVDLLRRRVRKKRR